ncbi:ATP-binding protein [Novosphingobium fuchskuhlense]|uniref:ATP-binding protein n=1 Tax=Novosphingobium fuchskuhlense TaxID=1117702 RepID=UPI0009E8F4F8|nr:ATP-binding protein [Novosphingobium fuchskuhlense]
MTATNHRFSADYGAFPAVNEWLGVQGGALAISPDIAFKIELCVEEIVTNTIKYGFGDDPAAGGWIEIGLVVEEGRVELRFTDNAPLFNPLAQEQHAPPASLEGAPIGGLGILLVRELSQSVRYDCAEGQNVLAISFCPPAPRAGGQKAVGCD